MSTNGNGKNDTVVLVLSLVAVVMAGLLSMATISIKEKQEEDIGSIDPFARSEVAARAGFEAARWHIECHGRIERGGLAPRYYINGAMYAVAWDDVDMVDSTVLVHSEGFVSSASGQQYRTDLDSKLKLTFLPSHKQNILGEYYSQNSHSAYSQK
jgi:hypothetical protein